MGLLGGERQEVGALKKVYRRGGQMNLLKGVGEHR